MAEATLNNLRDCEDTKHLAKAATSPNRRLIDAHDLPFASKALIKQPFKIKKSVSRYAFFLKRYKFRNCDGYLHQRKLKLQLNL